MGQKLNEIELAAIRIACDAPLKKSQYSPSAYISWRLILDLRSQLEAAGVDWKHIHKLVRAEKEKARASRQTETVE